VRRGDGESPAAVGFSRGPRGGAGWLFNQVIASLTCL
jgi:hypothetical protein